MLFRNNILKNDYFEKLIVFVFIYMNKGLRFYLKLTLNLNIFLAPFQFDF
mgnify:CR=1 FL=1